MAALAGGAEQGRLPHKCNRCPTDKRDHADKMLERLRVTASEIGGVLFCVYSCTVLSLGFRRPAEQLAAVFQEVQSLHRIFAQQRRVPQHIVSSEH
jgi:hypothetical protein